MLRWSLIGCALIVSLVFLLTPDGMTTSAQEETCPAIVQTALTALDAACSGTERNQVCYGNVRVQATPTGNIADFVFDTPGDIVSVSALGTLALSPMDTVAGDWGVALLRLQANLPDTLPGQNVIMLLFGEVVIDNAGGELPPRLTGTITANANLRGGPGTGFTVVGGATNDMAVEVEGRNADSSWFRIRLPDDDAVAWIFGNLIAVDGDVDELPVLEADDEAGGHFGPM
jgi:hypothetical protein